MEWLPIMISIPASGAGHCTAHIWFGPAPRQELALFYEKLRAAAKRRGIVQLGALPIGLTPGEHAKQESVPEDAGRYLDDLLAEAVDLHDAIRRGEVPYVDISDI